MKTVEILAGILVVLLLLAAAIWVLTPMRSPTPSWQCSSFTKGSPTGSWCVQWAELDGEVEYVAFSHDGKEKPPEIVAVRGNLPQKHPLSLVLPGKPEAPLPSGFNVFELDGGRFRQENIPLTVEQVKKYCRAQRDEYSISSLKDFLRKN